MLLDSWKEKDEKFGAEVATLVAQLGESVQKDSTLLHAAVSCASIPFESTLRTLFRLGTKIDAQDAGRSTPLHFACKLTDVPEDRISSLILNGADTEQEDIEGLYPLQLAVSAESTAKVALLVKLGANVNSARSLWFPERRCTSSEYFKAPPLHLAAFMGNLEIAKLLIGNNANTSLSFFGDSPAVIAAKSGNIHMLELLRLFGATYRFSGSLYGCYAVENGHKDLLMHLLNSKHYAVDINAMANYAAGSKQWEIVKLLVDIYEADVTMTNLDFKDDDYMPLSTIERTAKAGNLDMVAFMVRRIPPKEDFVGVCRKARQAAKSNGHLEIVEKLDDIIEYYHHQESKEQESENQRRSRSDDRRRSYRDRSDHYYHPYPLLDRKNCHRDD